MPSSFQPAKIHIFCSYADEDQKLETKLEKQLKSLELERQDQVFVLNKHKIQPGQEREREIDEQINRADLILLLISPDFIASDDCYGNQLNKALQRQTDGKTRIIPILLRPCNWKKLRFSPFQVLPLKQTYVTQWPQGQDAAFQHIVEVIDVIVQEIFQHGHGYIEPLRVRQTSNIIDEKKKTHITPQRNNATKRNVREQKQTQRETLKAEASVSSSVNGWQQRRPKRLSSFRPENLAKFMAKFTPINKTAFYTICLSNVFIIPSIIGLWLITNYFVLSLATFIVSFLVPIIISLIILISNPLTNNRSVAKTTITFFSFSWAIGGWAVGWIINTLVNWIRTQGISTGTVSQINNTIPIISAILGLIVGFWLQFVIVFGTNHFLSNNSREANSKKAIK
jgi:hypothetical protein